MYPQERVRRKEREEVKESLLKSQNPGAQTRENTEGGREGRRERKVMLEEESSSGSIVTGSRSRGGSGCG